MTNPLRLSDLKPGDRGIVRDLSGDPQLVQRLLEMGLTEEEEVSVVRLAPLGDPIEIEVRGYLLSLRKREAAAVILEQA